jgi:predicted Zn-dependent protease
MRSVLPIPVACRVVMAALLCLAVCGCKVSEFSLNDITPERIGMATSSVQTISKAARPLSDDEEYYVGRAVAARITATYPLYRNARLTEYLNLIGQSLALHTEKPATFGGYRFALLDSPEINAFACPGGIILITRGMLSSMKSEDELAAVLAHEIAHVIHRDGIGAIQSSRWSEAVLVIGSNAAKEFGPKDTAKLLSLFEGSIDDVVKTLVVNGYGREQEKNADAAALGYLAAAGYDPHGLVGYLTRLDQSGQGSKGGITATHPGTADRVENVRQALPPAVNTSAQPIRTKRFADMKR